MLKQVTISFGTFTLDAYEHSKSGRLVATRYQMARAFGLDSISNGRFSAIKNANRHAFEGHEFRILKKSGTQKPQPCRYTAYDMVGVMEFARHFNTPQTRAFFCEIWKYLLEEFGLTDGEGAA